MFFINIYFFAFGGLCNGIVVEVFRSCAAGCGTGARYTSANIVHTDVDTVSLVSLSFFYFLLISMTNVNLTR